MLFQSGTGSSQMFERNRVDNTMQQMTVAAEITLLDGSIHKGKFIVAAARSIFDVLNSDAKFLEFATHDGVRSLIATATLASVKITTAPATGGLKLKSNVSDQFCPFAVLGLERAAPWDDVRQAYLRLSKLYHPDLYANVALPVEIKDYLSAMAQRINTAYHALEAPQQAAKRAVVEKAVPVFASPQRF